MAATHVLFPGTFDPPTLGHLDLIQRAGALFGRVTVALADNAGKQTLFAVEERLELLRACCAGLANVSVARVDGLLVAACLELKAEALLRGLRSGSDTDYEAQMARTNRQLAPRIDTLFLVSSPAVAHLSSTLVRQIARLGGDCAPFVPPPVAAALARRFRAR
ncbi:MAG: pantetheine-phosphate adenylyltransferase [Planctomycetes bacterium]|nr:pantetheine-phosphate adenylyltransferase [Planctomycetota bacterium]